jgi:fatty acid CoA ligase FadD9
MILAHSRYSGQINVPDMFTRWLFSVVVTGLAPRSFYATGKVKPHYDGLPVDFTASAIATFGADALSGYHTYHVVNPHDDGISMDTFIDWAIEAGHPIQRIEDYDDWYRRFETALRALPDKQRQHSSLPLLHQLRRPMTPAAGALAPAVHFKGDVRKHGKEIPHLSAAFIRKYLEDLRVVGLVLPS